MKNVLILAALTVLLSTPATATILGSSHDMVATGFATLSGNTEICVFCHTPHGATAGTPDAPLWNNTAVDSTDFYTSATTDFASSVIGINATDARLCLACHENIASPTTPISQPTNLPNGTAFLPGGSTMSADSALGTDFSNDHPIGMDLTDDPGALDPYIKSIPTISAAFGYNPFYNGASRNTMWCSSCHDVHNGDPDFQPFLRIDNTGSALCKACHEK